MVIKKKVVVLLSAASGLLLVLCAAPRPSAQDDASNFRVNVVLVQLNVAVTDRKGNYVPGLRPQDFTVTEDRIPQKIATFEEGNGATTEVDVSAINSETELAPLNWDSLAIVSTIALVDETRPREANLSSALRIFVLQEAKANSAREAQG